MRFDQRFADGQPEAKPAPARAGALFERIENFRQGFRLNSKPGIRDFNMQLFVGIVAGRDMNLPIFGSKLDRIVDEVPKDLLQSSRIGAEMNLLRGEIEPKDKMFSLDLALINLKRVLQETMRIDNFEVKLDLALADTG